MGLRRSMSRKQNAVKREFRTLEFCIISAQDLKSSSKFRKMKTYAVAYIDPSQKVCTKMDTEGGTNPTWDANLSLQVDANLVEDTEEEEDNYYMNMQLTINIYCRGSIRDKLVGSVRILIYDAVRMNARSINKFPVASYLVFRPNGDPHGILNVCIPPGGKFPERFDSMSFKHDINCKMMNPVEEEDVCALFVNTASTKCITSTSSASLTDEED